MLIFKTPCFNGLRRWHSGQESACQCRRSKRHGFHPWVVKIPWRRKWQPTPVFLPGKLYEQRSLTVYSPWSHKESDITEPVHANTHFNKISCASQVLLPMYLIWHRGNAATVILFSNFCSPNYNLLLCVCVQCIQKISMYFTRLRFHLKDEESSLANFC